MGCDMVMVQALVFRHPGLQKVTGPHVNAALVKSHRYWFDLTQVLVWFDVKCLAPATFGFGMWP